MDAKLDPRLAKSLRLGDTVWIHHAGQTFSFSSRKAASTQQTGHQQDLDGLLSAPMPATVALIKCEEGARVKAGATLCILEAMKMEYHLTAPFEGIIKKIYCKIGDKVPLGAKLIEVVK